MGRMHKHGPRRGRPGFGPGFDFEDMASRRFGPGRGPRARRGDIRTAVLSVLAEGPLNGYQVIQKITERTEGGWTPSPGSVYPTVAHLRDEGLIGAESDGTGKALSLTQAGKDWLESHTEEAAAVWSSFQEQADDSRDVRRALRALMMAATQVFANGTQAQQEQALEVIKDARKRLYLILAEDDES